MGEIKNAQGASAEQVEAALTAYHEGGDFSWPRIIELFPGEVGGERKAMQAALSAAQAIEARQGGDAEGGSVEDKSAVAAGDVPASKSEDHPPSSTPGEVERLVERFEKAIKDKALRSRPSLGCGRKEIAEAAAEVDAARTALLSHISTAGRGEGDGDLASQAYDLGFAASAEGWNGEYPNNATETEGYARTKAENLARLLNKFPAAATNPQDQE